MSYATRLNSSRPSWTTTVKALMPPMVWDRLYRSVVVKDVPDNDRYQPMYSPWLAPEFRARFAKITHRTEVSIDRCWTIDQMVRQSLHIEGDVLEAGVYRGGTALLLKQALPWEASRRLMLFDSFGGMKTVRDGVDRHREGDFADTSLDSVSAFVGRESFIEYFQGWIPETFAGLEDRRLCFAHIDLDLYESILDCLAYVYPRLSPRGVIVFDDYGFASCPGARRAVESFFADKPERPLALMTGQAVVFKL